MAGFLGYLAEWRDSVESRLGLSKGEKAVMRPSLETGRLAHYWYVYVHKCISPDTFVYKKS